MRGILENKTTRFLIACVVIVVSISVAIFAFLGLYLSEQSTQTIREVSRMYMTGMSEQIAMHFETAIRSRLDQLDTLVDKMIPELVRQDQALEEELTSYAQTMEFEYLAFYRSDNTFDMLYGSQLEVVDPPPFLASLSSGEVKVAVGADAGGSPVILLGVPVQLEGSSCIALVAALPVSYITDTLSLEENADHVYSFIIRKDGSFVIHTGDASRESYFERALSLYQSVNGRDTQIYIDELSAAMAADQGFSAEISVSGETRQMYCAKLAHSEWFLLTFMPYSVLDEMVNGLTVRWTYTVLGCCALALVVLILVFARYYQELEHASRAKSEFLSNMSHDIRTPMNAIVNMTEIALTKMDSPDQLRNCLEKIALSSNHLLGLINDVLDMSKIESGKMLLSVSQVSLRKVVESIVSIIQPQVKAKGQQFNISIHSITAENVCCDSVRLNQVLINILGNAVKFTPEGGSIQFSLCQEPSPKGEDFVRTHIRVQDNGIGMSREFQEKIFDSFSREDNKRVQKTEGTGLGMAITKYIVDAMGGAIEVQSEQGRGSLFHITLDLQKASVTEEEMTLPGWRMLVVDDDENLCQSVVDSLRSIGVRPDWATNARSAIRMAEECHRRGEDYQIILLDWKLPDLDGIAAAREIRQCCGDQVPILLISAYDCVEIQESAQEAGVTGFIAKPLFKSTLFYGLAPYMGAQTTKDTRRDAELMDFTGKRVLLAEDNDLNWEIAEELLTSELNLELEWAENGKICVEKFQAAEPGFYSAILMDVRMPVMTGYEATEAIRALDRPDAKTIPIIAMTADAFAEDIKRCLACGMNAHIAKPVNVREIAEKLKRYMK